MTAMNETAGLLLAMATPGDQSVSPWVQLAPFVFILAIFYVIIILPMRRRQKKVQQFLQALKVNDRVVTTGGIYGVITKINERSVQLQIADKVRIELSKAAIGGYQGQEPVAPENPQ
jgi:preprotein translocase subunit YajC